MSTVNREGFTVQNGQIDRINSESMTIDKTGKPNTDGQWLDKKDKTKLRNSDWTGLYESTVITHRFTGRQCVLETISTYDVKCHEDA